MPLSDWTDLLGKGVEKTWDALTEQTQEEQRLVRTLKVLHVNVIKHKTRWMKSSSHKNKRLKNLKLLEEALWHVCKPATYINKATSTARGITLFQRAAYMMMVKKDAFAKIHHSFSSSPAAVPVDKKELKLERNYSMNLAQEAMEICEKAITDAPDELRDMAKQITNGTTPQAMIRELKLLQETLTRDREGEDEDDDEDEDEPEAGQQGASRSGTATPPEP